MSFKTPMNMRVKMLLALLMSFAVLNENQAQVKKTTPAKKTTTTTAKKTTTSKAPVKKVPPKTVAQKPIAKPPIVSTEKLIEISTDYGTMVAKLYDSTPLHRDNFLKLVEQGFYDSLLFHRVIENFMIQGGDPTSKYAAENVPVGSGSAPGDRIPAEFKSNLFHKKGALAAARDNNPERASSNCQFYIVQGKKLTEAELEGVYKQRVLPSNPNFKYTAAQKEIYARLGGTPFLDQNYTVFGEVISGLEVIDKIAKVAKGPADRPLENVRMKIRLLN
jgi:peptidyl-prolyl cis-trans isomerase B (cyclophilin B)